MSLQARIQEPETCLVSFLWTQPDWCRLFTAYDQIHIILCPKAVCNRAQCAVGIRREVHPRSVRLEVQHRADETWILVRESVMFLPGPGRSFDIVQRATGLPPKRLLCHFDEFGVLDHHGVDDAQEGFVGGEEAGAACEGVALKHALTSVLGKNFNNASAFRARQGIPLEVTSGAFEDCVKFVGGKLIRGEDAECPWITATDSGARNYASRGNAYAVITSARYWPTRFMQLS